MTRKTLIALFAGGAALLVAIPVVTGFPFGNSWHMPAHGTRAGAGGIYGTGGTSEYGITCAHCHIDGAGLIDARITPTPAWSDVGGQMAYTPGRTYAIDFVMTDEHLGLGQGMNNLNGFALMIEDESGNVIRGYQTDSGVGSQACPGQWPQTAPTGTTYVYGDCHGVLYVPRANETQWHFNWTAPAAGAGTLIVYWGVVDGDSAGDSSLDDDVKIGTLRLVEAP